MPYFVYILASKPHGTLYTGVTNDIARRIWEHKENVAEGFTKKYNVKTLVYMEMHEDVQIAIQREKSIKRWSRAKKYAAIEETNSAWDDFIPHLTTNVIPAAKHAGIRVISQREKWREEPLRRMTPPLPFSDQRCFFLR